MLERLDVIREEAKQILEQFPEFFAIDGDVNHLYGIISRHDGKEHAVELLFLESFPSKPPVVRLSKNTMEKLGMPVYLDSLKDWSIPGSRTITILDEIISRIEGQHRTRGSKHDVASEQAGVPMETSQIEEKGETGEMDSPAEGKKEGSQFSLWPIEDLITGAGKAIEETFKGMVDGIKKHKDDRAQKKEMKRLEKEKELLEKVKSIFEKSGRVDLEVLRMTLALPKGEFYKKHLLEWVELFNLEIDGQQVVVQESMSVFIDRLDKQFASWHDAEMTGSGKI